MSDAVVWAIALPLAGALVAILAPGRGNLVGVTASCGVTAAAVALLWQVGTGGPVRYALGGWTPGLGIALHADGLAAVLILMTALVALAVSVYATAYFTDPADRTILAPLAAPLGGAQRSVPGR